MPGFQNNGPRSDGNNSAQFNVTTSSFRLYSNNTCLNVSLYNQNLNIGIINATKDSEGHLRYPGDNEIRALVTAERATALRNIIVDELIPAMKEHRPFERAIMLNQRMTNMLKMEVNSDGQVFLHIYNNIGENRVPSTKATYMFANTPTLGQYNSETGEYTQGPSDPSQIYLLGLCLEEFVYQMSCAGVHMSRFVERYQNRRIIGILEQMASKLGVPMESIRNSGNTTYRYGGNGGSRTPFNGNNATSAPAAPQEQQIQNLGEMMSSDLPF